MRTRQEIKEDLASIALQIKLERAIDGEPKHSLCIICQDRNYADIVIQELSDANVFDGEVLVSVEDKVVWETPGPHSVFIGGFEVTWP